MRTAAYALSLASFALSVHVANANLLSNGSFELAQQTGPSRVAMTALADWTSAGGFNLLEQGVNGTSGVAAQEGTQFVSMGHSGATGSRLEQTIVTETGVAYEMSLWTRSIQGGPNPPLQTLQVLFESNTATIASASLDIVDPNAWTEHRVGFTATGPSTTVALIDAVGGGTANIAVDNLWIAVVPEPTSLGCLVAGAAGLTLRRRRQRP